jgi:hypothetical protein
MSDPNGAVSARIVEAVARTSGGDPLELPPLQGTVDTDALDALYADASDDAGSAPAMRFSYAGYQVHVRSATDIEIREPAGGAGDPTEE